MLPILGSENTVHRPWRPVKIASSHGFRFAKGTVPRSFLKLGLSERLLPGDVGTG